MKILVLLLALCWAHVLAFKEPRLMPNRFARTFGQVVNSLFPGKNEWHSNVKGCFSNFRCYNGTCVSADLTCDGIPDCREAEDEIDSYCNGKRRVDPRNRKSPVATKLFKETWNKIGDLLPMRQAMCSDIQFFCSSDSKCISVTNLCDQTNECSQGEDEQNCEYVTCPDNYMKCDTGKCIPNYWICDEIRDCPAAEDETGLDCSTRVCSGNQFRCDTGACLPLNWHCDGQVDCLRGEDEENCNICPSDTISCQDGQSCITQRQVCDGVRDCADGTDEQNCNALTIAPNTEPTTKTHRRTAEPPCSDGLLCKIGSYVYCIPKWKICDGIVNCWDGSDEDQCTTPKITTEPTTTPLITTPEITTKPTTPIVLTDKPPCKDGLLCKIGSYVYCIPKQKICDGVVNCWDGSDEDQCTTPKVTTEPTTTPLITTPEITTKPTTPIVLTDEPPCKDGLLCKIGSYVYCIPKQKICDGVVNCWDGSDEDQCTTPKITTEPTTTPLITTPEITTKPTTPIVLTDEPPCKDGLLCKIGSYVYCIPKQKICDGVVNCWDGSDEDQCTTPKVTTEPTTTLITTPEITTKPTTPIVLTEEPPCKDGLLCKVGSYVYCIPKQKICDGVVNCWDGSDEDSCTTPKVTTKPTTTPTLTTKAAPCHDGLLCKIGPYMYCTPKSKLCDGVMNCWDGSDEDGCTTPNLTTEPTTTPKTTTEVRATSLCGQDFLCRLDSWLYCIPSQKRCDGVVDCPDMSDEKQCPTPVPMMTTIPRPVPSTMIPSCPGYVCAVTSLCIPNMLLCDGASNCPLGDDEVNCAATTTSSPVPCVLGQFECNDGSCISVSKSCDNIMDCPNGEDEANCQVQTCAVKFQCKTDGVCLEENKWCDGTSDCTDGSDEMDCGSCSDGEFACSSEMCIERNKLCDGVPDCPGPNDENGCTVIEQCVGLFDCGNGYCVDMAQRCDGELHCNNGQDEIGCPVRRGCVGSDFQCRDGKCISSSMRCNGVYGDCLTGEDEENCDECKHYMCPNKRCLGLREMCDGVNDCLPGGEDENPAECEAYLIKDKKMVVSDKTAEKLANQISILLKNGGESRGDEQIDEERNSQSAPDQLLEEAKKQSSKINDPHEMRRVQHLKELLQRHFNKV